MKIGCEIEFPRYRTSGDSMITRSDLFIVGAPNGCPSSGGGDRQIVEDHADLAAQKVQEDRHTIAVRHALVERETGGENPLGDAHPVAAREPGG